jgi:hypothetical protein
MYIRCNRKEWQREYGERKRMRGPDADDLIKCQVCGRSFRMIGSHVVQVHDYETAREYREEFGYDVKKGQLVPSLKELKGKQALENKTYLNLRVGKKFWFKPGDKRAGRYHRSQETIIRLMNQFRSGSPYRSNLKGVPKPKGRKHTSETVALQRLRRYAYWKRKKELTEKK